jgi:GalNAc5-diNAcBac-PP-undecaprenol beta-1,3-glucosyltransferase
MEVVTSATRVTGPQGGFRPGVVSIVVPTYNRPATLGRALDSVLGQDYPGWELIVVDDGQLPGTVEALSSYADPRISVVSHDRNRGVSAARNTGLDHVTGEWFTFLDDDDELVPHALSTLMKAAREHPDADAFTCNCINTATGVFSGVGLDSSQRVDWPGTYNRLRGEHWGITKTALLRGRRFDERTRGGLEGVLWLKLSAEARRYYVHEGLRLFHTEGADRTSKAINQVDLRQRLAYNLPLVDDEEYLALLRANNPSKYTALTFYLALALIDEGRRAEAWPYCREYRGPKAREAFLFASWALGRPWIGLVSEARSRVRSRDARLHRRPPAPQALPPRDDKRDDLRRAA